METLPALYGVACLACAASVRGREAHIASVTLVAGWAVANLLWTFDALDLNPLLDGLTGIVTLALWRASRVVWLQRLVALIVCQMLMHVVYFAYGVDFQCAYLTVLNWLFAGQIAVVWWGGGGADGFFDRCRNRFRRVGVLVARLSAEAK